MKNSLPPCSVELRNLSTFSHELTVIRCRNNNGNCLLSANNMAVVIKYLETRIKEIQDRLP